MVEKYVLNFLDTFKSVFLLQTVEMQEPKCYLYFSDISFRFFQILQKYSTKIFYTV